VTGALCAGLALAACQPALQPIVAPAPAIAPGGAAARPPATGHDRVSPDALMRAATAVFGDSTSFDGVPDGALAEEVTWDIDVRSYETHERVEHYLRLFSGPARERMAERISRGTRYESMIRTKMRLAGMPEDLFYLALIESGYDPHAYSSAAAVGMWQFMTTTGRDVGLRIDWWVDERRDPARSTDAAIRFLGDLQRQFGSLFLAAAAYNGGPGRVARGLTRFASAIGEAEGDDRFFALAEQDYLHSETKNYVPQLIAAALVAKEPDKFGLQVERRPAYGYDSVLVEPGTSLGAVARASALALDSLIELNPGLLRGVAPPDRAEWVRVPRGMDSLVVAAYVELAPEDRLGWTEVTPKTGETVAALAKRHEVTTRELGWYNPGLRTARSGAITAGQRVRVPTREAILGALVVADPSIERYGSSTAASTHVVKRGEVLGTIASRYGLTVARLKAMNGLRSDNIRVGQTLVVRGGTTPARSATASGSTRSSSGATTGRAAAATTTHSVRSGESLGVIAQRYGTSVARIKALNGLKSDKIEVGQKLVVRRG
jgi:membrane-bound lytic murein transglycosylase D